MGVLQRQDFDIYVRIIEMYSKRQLSFNSDILNAATGILSVVHARLGGQMLAGLPSTYLDLAIMWTPAGPLDRTTAVGKSDNTFPSWSWTSWTGGKQYRLSETGRHTYRSLDHEYATSEVSSFTLVHQGRLIRISKSLGDMRASETRNLDSILHKDSTKYERQVPRYVPYSTLVLDAVGEPEYGSNVLQFRAQAISSEGWTPVPSLEAFITDPEHGSISGEARVVPLLDRGGKQCGLLFNPLSKTSHRAGVPLGRLEYILISSFRDTESRRSGINTMNTRLRPFDERAFPWKGEGSGLCNVMLIEWFGEIADRFTVVQVHRGAWEAESPQWKQIRLA